MCLQSTSESHSFHRRPACVHHRTRNIVAANAAIQPKSDPITDHMSYMCSFNTTSVTRWPIRTSCLRLKLHAHQEASPSVHLRSSLLPSFRVHFSWHFYVYCILRCSFPSDMNRKPSSSLLQVRKVGSVCWLISSGFMILRLSKAEDLIAEWSPQLLLLLVWLQPCEPLIRSQQHMPIIFRAASILSSGSQK